MAQGIPLSQLGIDDAYIAQLQGKPAPQPIVVPVGVPAESVGVQVPTDMKTGGSNAARFAVGSAVSPADKLATIRKFYADAAPYDNGNFSFINPDTGKVTLFNPKGLDRGDWAGAAPEIGEFVGGLLGASVAGVTAVPPSVAAAPPTAGVSLLGIPLAARLGYGLGAAGGKEATQNVGKFLFGTEDTRSLPTRLIDSATTTGLNSLFYDLSPVTTPIANAVKNTFVPIKQGVVDAFGRLGVGPSAGQITDNAMVKSAEKAVGYTPGGTGTMTKFAENQVNEIAKAADDIASQYGSAAATKQQAGKILTEAGDAAATRFNSTQTKLYDDAYNLIGRDTPAKVTNLQAYRDQLAKEIEAAPETYASTKGVVLAEIDKTLADAAKRGGELPFYLVRSIRSNVGSENAGRAVKEASKDLREARGAYYDALTKDIYGTAKAVGPDAEKALNLADRYTRFNMNVNMDTIKKLQDAGVAPENLWTELVATMNKGDSKLLPILRQMKPDEKGNFAATVIEQMGLAKAGAQDASGEAFSPTTFLTNWSKMSKEAKDAVFDYSDKSILRAKLDDLATVTGAVKDMEKYSNNSGTARQVLWSSLLAGGGGAGGQMLSGSLPLETMGIAAGTTAGAFGLSKLFTNASFVSWLKDASQAVGKNPETLTNYVSRLATVAKFNPAIQQEIGEYAANIKANITTEKK